MKPVSLARTKTEKQAEKDRWDRGPVPIVDEHSSGHHIELDHHDLKKLGVNETPAPGDEYRGEFHGRVIESSENADENDEAPRRRVRVLLHHVAMERRDDGDGDEGKADRRQGLRGAIEKAVKDDVSK